VSGPPAKGIGHTSARLVPLALLARGAGFLVPAAVALWFGVGPVTDAWYWALALPTFALVLAGSSLATTATPALARLRSQDPTLLPGALGALLAWAALAALAAGALVALGAGAALPAISGFSAPTIALTRRLLWELVPAMVLVATGAGLRSACEVHGCFRAVTLGPLIRALTIIATTGLLLRPLGPHALPAGLAAGELVQDLAWGLALARGPGLRPRLALRLPALVRQVGRDLLPVLGGEILVALNPVVDKAFAATLPAGAVATLEYADRARVIPQTLLESTLVMVAFATWSALHARGDRDAARAGIGASLRWVLALGAPALAGMFIGRRVLVGLLFERGAFTHADTLAAAAVLAWYLPGVLPTLLGILAVKAHVLERNLRLVLILGGLSAAANALLDRLLVGPLGLAGLALSTTAVAILVPALYLGLLLRGWGRSSRKQALQGVGAAVVLALAAVILAATVELSRGAPEHLADPTLWGAAGACVGLLLVGRRLARGAPPAPG